MLIDLVQLRTFVAVAEEQHLTRASERLHISQSAASAHVRAIEDALGVQLFVRTNRSLELTRAGELLLGRAKGLLGEASLFASFARELSGKLEGHLVVGSSSEPGTSRIGRIVAALRERHPLVGLELRARPSSGTRQALQTGEFDLGMLLGPPLDPALTCYRLTSVPFVVAAPAAWKARVEAADRAALARLPWIAPTAMSAAYTTMLHELFEARGLELNAVARFDNAALAREMLEAGVGLALMREDQARQGQERGVLVVSGIARIEYPLNLAHPTSRRNDPLIRAFVEAAAHAWPGLQVDPPTGSP